MATLKEKFNDLVPKEFGGMQEPTLSECVKIADDFAIGFAEWHIKAYENNIIFDEFTTKELLEIYKTEVDGNKD